MNIVSYGGGTNSTAMLIGMYQRNIPVDLMLFADTGGERPETYKYIRIMNKWLKSHGMPKITIVNYRTKDGELQTLEQELLKYKNLPAPCYGGKSCSQKYKISPQEKFCNNYKPCKEIWKLGEKVTKYIGYDAGEEQRKDHAIAYNILDKKYESIYPLIDWEWYREDCIKEISEQGLPLPGKSSCFFCPSMKKPEILELRKNHPDLFERALAIEDNAKENLKSIKGLGRDYSWRELVNAVDNQVTLCAFADSVGTPCGCYDG